MTTTNRTGKGPMTGEVLLQRVRDIGAGIPTTDMAYACGYRMEVDGETVPDVQGWFTAVLEAKGLPKEKHQLFLEVLREEKEKEEAEAIEQNISRIAVLGFRWLVYQYALDHGLEDDQLAEQQKEFFSQLERAAMELMAALGRNEGGMVLTDVLGVMTHLFSYNEANRWYPDNTPTEEERRKNFDVAMNWVNGTHLFYTLHGISDQDFTKEEVEDYKSFRWDHHSMIANYFRTVTLDFSTGSRHQDVAHFAADLQRVKSCLSMLDENSRWTTKGLIYLMCACITTHWRADKSPEEITQFASELVIRWVDEGHAIRAEHLKR